MLILPNKNLAIFNFADIFKENIDVQFLNQVDSFEMVDRDEIDFSNRDVKRILLHSVIYGICEYILSQNRKEKIAIVFDDRFSTYNLQIFTFIKPSLVEKYILDTLKKIIKILPVNIFFHNSLYWNLIEKIKDNTGEGIEFINTIDSRILTNSKDTVSFNKIKHFSKKHHLTFLSKEYFNKVMKKQLIYSA